MTEEPINCKNIDSNSNSNITIDTENLARTETVTQAKAATIETKETGSLNPKEGVNTNIKTKKEKKQPKEKVSLSDRIDRFIDKIMNPEKDAKGNEPNLGWNWGAFCFSWIWGLGNSCYIPLLIWLSLFYRPLILFMMIICGMFGNVWAWKNGKSKYRDAEEFNRVQDSWNRAGKTVAVLSLIVVALMLIFVLFALCVGLCVLVTKKYIVHQKKTKVKSDWKFKSLETQKI